MIQNVLFACDFSSSSNRAMGYALDLAQRCDATLHFLHIHEVSLGPFVKGDPAPQIDDPQLPRRFEERCREELATCSSTPDDDHLRFLARRSSAAAPVIVEAAKKRDIDLIVMGTHGRRGVQRAVFGSTAEEVLRTAPCPVLTARGTDDEPASPQDADSIQRLVVPIDFSDASRAALRYAARLASAYSAPMTLVHAVQLPRLPAAYGIDVAETNLEEVQARSRSTLEEWGGEVDVAADKLSTVVTTGDPASTILETASTPEALLVMATQGLSGLKRAVLGSVAESVLRRAVGPVLAGRSFPE